MQLLTFFLACEAPSVTSQQKRAVRIGSGIRFFKSAKQKAADGLYASLLLPHRPAQPFEGALALTVNFVLPWRKSEKKSVLRECLELPCITRPDCSNRIKQLEDSMTALRFWNDDGQVARLVVTKRYGDEPGIRVTIETEPGLSRLF